MQETVTTTISAADKAFILNEFAVSTVYIMGVSFIVGSAVTVLLLLLLDYFRDAKQGNTSK